MAGTRDDFKLQNNAQTYCVEDIWIECHMLGIRSNVFIGVIYRHPNCNIDNYTKDLETTLHLIHRDNKLSFICGDFNVNILNTEHSDSKNYASLLLSENFIPQITIPT